MVIAPASLAWRAAAQASLIRGGGAGDTYDVIGLAFRNSALKGCGNAFYFDGGVVEGQAGEASFQQCAGQVSQSHVNMGP